MRTFWLPGALVLPITAISMTATTMGDTLDLMRTSLATGIPNQAEEEEAASRTYMRVNVGANFTRDANVHDFASSGTAAVAPGSGSTAGLQGVHFGFDLGADSSFAIGYELMPGFSIEGEFGFAWNPVRSVSGIVNVPTGVLLNPNTTSTLGGGSGDLIQIPAFVNFNADLPLSTDESEFWPFIGMNAYLTIHAGVGATYSHMKFDNGTIAAVGAIPTTTLSLDGGGFAVGYQVGTSLRIEIAHNLEFGVFGKVRGTARSNFGSVTYSNPGLFTAGSMSTSALLNYTFGVNLRYEF
jgi:hypothetical protein